MPNDKKRTTTVQLTEEGLAELQAELEELKSVKLPKVIERVAVARAHGDLSENAEYTAAKEEQQFLETRISQIEDVLSRAEVVQHTKNKTTVGVGSMVTVKQKGKNKQRSMEIVGEFESDPINGKISAASPLGKALVGKKKGDVAVFQAPGGEVEYSILNVA